MRAIGFVFFALCAGALLLAACGDGESSPEPDASSDIDSDTDTDADTETDTSGDPDHIWSKSFGGGGIENKDYAKGIAIDSDDNIILVGQFDLYIDLGGGQIGVGEFESFFVAKFTPAGEHVWSKGFGTDMRHINVDADNGGNVLISGSFEGTVDIGDGHQLSSVGRSAYLIKFDSSGEYLWSTMIASDSGYCWTGRAVSDSEQNVIAAGMFEGTIEMGGEPLSSVGQRDTFLVKYDPTGEQVWSARFGALGDDGGHVVAVDSSNGVVLYGVIESLVDFGDGPIGTVDESAQFLAKFDALGNHLWSRTVDELEFASRVVLDSADNVLAIGGNFSVNIAKYDSQGAFQWSASYSGGGSSCGQTYGADLRTDAVDDIIITGQFGEAIDFGGGQLVAAGGCEDEDFFAVGFDPAGEHLWSFRYGDEENESGQGVAVDSEGNLLLTGHFRGGLDMGGGELGPAEGWDIYLLKRSI